MGNIIMWPCGTWCYADELDEFNHRSDDYRVVRTEMRYFQHVETGDKVILDGSIKEIGLPGSVQIVDGTGWIFLTDGTTHDYKQDETVEVLDD